MTVSNAYNRPDQLSAEVRQRIFAAAERLGYPGPDPVGRALRRGSNDVIGVVLGDELPYAFSDPGSTAFLLGVTTAAERAGVSVQLISAATGHLETKIRGAAVDGVIVFGGGSRDSVVSAVRRRGLPLVLANGRITHDVPFVAADNKAGARLVAEHVRARGHGTVAVLAQLTRRAEVAVVAPTRLRSAHFLAHAQRAQGVRAVFDDATIWEAAGNSIADGRAAARQILTATPRPSAVLATTDVLALGVLLAADELGLEVGRDLAVTGFDDIAEAARSRPPLTTVHQDLYAQGVAAFELIGSNERPSVQPAQLVVRTSTTGVQP